MGDFLLDAVAQFLKGAQWLDPVNAFMHTHKLAFVGVVGPQEAYSLQQHAIFVEFKGLADQLLEGIVQDLGCEPAAFVSALEEAVVNEAGGPKEEEVQLLMKTLLAYDDFHGFCTLMQSYVEWNAVPTMPPDDSEVQAGHEELSCRDDVPFDAKKYFGSPEWILQEVVARSLLDAQASGHLDHDDAAYLPWAEAIMSMKTCYDGQLAGDESSGEASNARIDCVSSESVESKMAAELQALEAKLVHERLKVDLLVAQRLSERNAGMRQQMAALCQASSGRCGDATTASMAAEEELGMLCERLEAIQMELKAIKTRCFGFKSVSPVHLDEIYLFLKEKVHFKHDLAQCETEIADFLFRRIQPSESAIVPHLLQWLLLESEAHEVQQDIQSRSFLSPRAEAKEDDPNDRWVQQWSDPDNAYYYTNAVTGEGRWDPPTSKDGEPILGYWNHDNEWVPYTFLTPGPADMTADGKEEASSTSDLKLPPLESKPWTPSAVLMDIGSALESAQSTHRAFSTDMLDVEASLQKVLQEHADESKKLEIALQVEHARQIQDIQRRKAQRRKERKMKKAMVNDSADAKEASIAPPPPVDLPSPLSALSGCQINICLPEGGKFDLLNLLSEADERVRRERRGDGPKQEASAPSSLNATSLRYLAEKIAPTSKLIEIEEI
ncbi:hypothetical protein H310_07599 [Aphanomyces invadans]|uniref:Cilia- and flagella-associated protein 36 n=1 Tax=Aphanomyces invadans TaxID=157072 RepID=A0A024U2S0_9STRA|nr:hypothetical protein H310_07599 [Aphanomyces invadans]ETW00202.1 hypothetical protein H310_07599 [Aphanomyces invadans]|eukprot:XP_008871227.1 hypothetical protein H310_07599 [Aphanomyces invadans]